MRYLCPFCHRRARPYPRFYHSCKPGCITCEVCEPNHDRYCEAKSTKGTSKCK